MCDYLLFLKWIATEFVIFIAFNHKCNTEKQYL